VRNLRVPAGPAEAESALLGLLGPIGTHPHWVGIVHFLVGEKAPLLYSADRVGENQNLSNWFCLLNDRDGFYHDDPSGQIVRALYVAHELSHMLPATPHDVDVETFAATFDDSERFASYETELGIYADIPELMEVAPWHPLLAEILSGDGVDLANAAALMSWRDAVIAEPALLARVPSEGARLASYGKNRPWARAYWDRLERIGWWADPIPCAAPALTVADHRDRIHDQADVPVSIPKWERLVIDNVRRAYRLCGLADPHPADLDQAAILAAALDGHPLALEETATGLGRPGEEMTW
jgi:hypothetical protein